MSANFNTVAKPGGNRCNLACRYCFYLENEVPRPGYATMDDLTLEAYIHNTISSTPSQNVEFCWQGGEPTLCGLDFFAKVVELQQRYRGNKIIANSLQTNGILLNDKWAVFCVVMDFWSDYPLMALRHSTTPGVRRAAENPPGKKLCRPYAACSSMTFR